MLICCKSFERSHRHTKRYFALHIDKKSTECQPYVKKGFFFTLSGYTTGPVGSHSKWHLNSFSFFFLSFVCFFFLFWFFFSAYINRLSFGRSSQLHWALLFSNAFRFLVCIVLLSCLVMYVLLLLLFLALVWKIFYWENFMAQSQHKCFGFNWSYGGNTCGLSFDEAISFFSSIIFFFLLMKNDNKLFKLFVHFC